MADLLATGSTWLHQQRQAHATQSVTIARGSQFCTASATPSTSRHVAVDAAGVYVSIQTQDFVFRAQDYAPTGVASEPVIGDEITYLGLTFQVLRPSEDEPCFAYCDQARENIIVFTKER